MVLSEVLNVKRPKCKMTGKCFARDHGFCNILMETSEKCSFQKPDRAVTNGVRYKFSPWSCPSGNDRTIQKILREWMDGKKDVSLPRQDVDDSRTGE